jgi:hypothetical protein
MTHNKTNVSKVDITNLKNFASTLPIGLPLREILVLEDNELRLNVFLARLPIWLKLSRLPKTGGAISDI